MVFQTLCFVVSMLSLVFFSNRGSTKIFFSILENKDFSKEGSLIFLKICLSCQENYVVKSSTCESKQKIQSLIFIFSFFPAIREKTYGLQRLQGSYPSPMITSRDEVTSFRFLSFICFTEAHVGRWNFFVLVFST